ncbi:MAG TPA: peptide ABC transporter substrate-binding protein [Planctomycetota bacterium]|nr:peptide ABC transporter substrate-binding protein [Planctomycetota bacterium]
MLKGVPRLLLSIVLAGVAACGGAAEDPNTLIVNNSTEPQTLDPALEKGQPEYHITIALYEGLTVYDPKDLSVKPGVAESWELGGDGTVYTFHLRPAKWSNGDPVTAADFEWSWKRVLDPALGSEYVEQVSRYLKNGMAYFDGAAADGTIQGWAGTKPEKRLEDAKSLVKLVQRRHADPLKALIAAEKDQAVSTELNNAFSECMKRPDVTLGQVGVKAKDDRTLVVTLEAPTAYFLDLAAFFTYFPVHRKTVETHGKDWTRPEHLVGNGPFRMKTWKVKDHILLDRNPNYWDAANVADLKLKFLPVENASTAFNLYEKGRIHWLTEVPRDYIEELLNRPDYHTGPFLTTYFYGFNLNKGVTKDKRVRQALARAIDRQKIVKFITRAGEIPAESLVPPGLPGYEPAKTNPFDPEAASKLLADAGYPGGKGFPKIEILYNTQDVHKKIAAAIQEMWRQNLHIESELRNVEWKIYLDMQSRMEFDVIRRAWIADYNDPNTFLDMFTSANGNNNTGFANAEYDRLVAGAAKETDPAKRMKLLHGAEAVLMDELPIVPMYFYITKNMWKPEVTGIYDNVRDTHPYNRIRLAEKPGK